MDKKIEQALKNVPIIRLDSQNLIDPRIPGNVFVFPMCWVRDQTTGKYLKSFFLFCNGPNSNVIGTEKPPFKIENVPTFCVSFQNERPDTKEIK